jgi:hypothetical protein
MRRYRYAAMMTPCPNLEPRRYLKEAAMRATRDELPILFGSDPAAIRGTDWGDLRAMVISLPAGTDLAPVLKGLPNDLCPCPHWGYVIKGRMRVIYADREEVLQAGDLFYLPPAPSMPTRR